MIILEYRVSNGGDRHDTISPAKKDIVQTCGSGSGPVFPLPINSGPVPQVFSPPSGCSHCNLDTRSWINRLSGLTLQHS